MAQLRSQMNLVIAVSLTGMAACLLDGGRTSHSRFLIPLQIDAHSVSRINPDSRAAQLLRECKLIIWDEASASHRFAYECVDRLLKDLMQNDRPFGGKVSI